MVLKKWYETRNALLIACILSVVASIVAFAQIGLHLKHYSNGNHQRHILRIIFLVPIYALLSFAALMRPKHSLDLDTFRDCYESWVVYNFLALCLSTSEARETCKITCKGKSCLRAFGRA